MYIDVIVPSFDESGENVLISTWYKKVGDKISNGEVIADAETSTIACGITSGYDCFLSKIIAKEGDTVPQGSKIAVIEVNVDKPNKEISNENLRETIEEELGNIRVPQEINEESEEAQEKKQDEIPTQDANKAITSDTQDEATTAVVQNKSETMAPEDPQQAAAASRAQRRQALKDMESGKISAEEIEKMRAHREALQNTETIIQHEVKKEDKTEKNQEEYTLSISSDNVSDDLVAKNVEDIIDEKNDFMEEDSIPDKTSEKEDVDSEQDEFIGEESKNVIESFSEQAEKKFKSILKDAEFKVLQEADKLREKIIEDAKVSALAESEVMKAKILKEYEDRAAKDAGEMHKKIVQGSISEAQNTRTKLIEEAKAEALKEAEEIKTKIKEEAQKQAEEEASLIKQNTLANAERQAKEEANKISKEIIEKAIDDSKAEANEIKKDIIKSAGRYAKRESEQLIKEELKHARKESQRKAEEIISSTIIESKICADEMKEEVINKTKACVKEVMDNLMQSILTGSQQEIDQSKDFKEKIAESVQEGLDQVINTKDKIMDEINQNRENTMKEMSESKNQMIGGIKDSIYQATKLSEEIKSQLSEATKIKETLTEKLKENIDQNLDLKNEIIEEIKQHYGKICEDISSYVRKTIDEVKGDTSANIDQKTQEVQDSCLAHDVAKEIIEKKVNTEQNKIVEKLPYAKPESMEDIQSENANEEIPKENLNSKEDEVVRKLLNIKEDVDNTPGMYADNWNKPKIFYSPDDKRENIDFLKQRISEKMKDAYDSSVIATISNEVDMSAIISLEKAFGEAFSKKYNTRLGFTPFFIMAAVEALKQYKVFNAHVHKDEIVYKNHFDISVITCGNDGISAPVIRDADKLNFAEIERKMIALSRRAVEGTLSVEEVSNGTFTVVNAGIYGSLMGTDILTPPQVATLSVHKMHNRPVATDEGVEIKPMLYVSLSYDHRIADTKLAAEFLSKIKNYVENPGWQLLGL